MSEVISIVDSGVRILRVNRPQTKNAYNTNVYNTVSHTLDADGADDQIIGTIITGTGEFYSSGFDIKSAVSGGENERQENFNGLKRFIHSIINYPKLLIAVVNGPAIGISFTSAVLCDIIYASESAFFEAPFVKLGLCAEGCSSYTFERILGRSKASELILLGERLSVQEAYRLGLVAKVIPKEKLDDFMGSLIEKVKELSVNCVKINKSLMGERYKAILCECCDKELDQLLECFESQEFADAIVKFMSRKSKL